MSLERTADLARWLPAIENASFGVWDLDPRLETVHYSPRWKAHLGFPRIHAPDSTEFWRCRVHPDDLDAMQASLRSHLEGHSASYAMRFRLRSNGSGYRTVLSRGRVVARDDLGNTTRMLGTMVDLTGRRATAASHGLATEDPAQVIEVPRLPLHVLLGVACPLAVVSGSASERFGAEAADEARASRRLVESISDLLDLALREAGAAP